MKEVYIQELRGLADEVVTRGTLVFDTDNTVAYACVIPPGLRDDLASVLADIQLEEEGA